MQKHIISTSDSNSMRGVAIVLIVLHNLIHIFHPLKENEFFYHPHNASGFLNSLHTFSDTLWLDILSYLGWYGVAAFLFLSGYGLVRKYEIGGSAAGESFFQFMKYQVKKIFLLLFLPYLCYILVSYLCFGTQTSVWQALSHLCLVANFWPNQITPGIYWFFGLMVQLYLCYYLFFFKKSILPLLVVNAVSLVSMVLCIYYDQQYPLLYFIRHQCLGWFLPFSLGILYARYNLSIVFEAYWKNLLMFIVGSALLIYANVNAYLWLFTPVVSIALAIYGCELLKKLKYSNQLVIYLGSISAFIYAIHPIVRMVFLGKIHPQTMLSIFLYLLISILLAMAYKPVHGMICKLLNKAKDKKE